MNIKRSQLIKFDALLIFINQIFYMKINLNKVEKTDNLTQHIENTNTNLLKNQYQHTFGNDVTTKKLVPHILIYFFLSPVIFDSKFILLYFHFIHILTASIFNTSSGFGYSRQGCLEFIF